MALFSAAAARKRTPIVNDPANFSAVDDGDDAFVVVFKSAAEESLLLSALGRHFIFSGLESDAVLDVIARMQKLSARKGDYLIRQGDSGETFYLLACGSAKIILDGVEIGAYAAGASFGELALLYASPRAASIVAAEDCTLWSLDLKTFHRLAISKGLAESEGRVAFLKKVPLLSTLSHDALSRIADALQKRAFSAGDRILTEGDVGDAFYIVESGAVKCTHQNVESAEQLLLELKRGDYFGEMALLLDEPRHADVSAVTQVVCYAIDRQHFVRLFGDLRKLLAQQMRVRILRSVTLLCGLGDEILDSLAVAMRIQVFGAGEHVVRQGEAGSRFYIINDGTASVTKDLVDAEGLKVGETAIGSLQPQGFFGERSLMNDEARAANVVAVEALECLVLDRKTFKTYLASEEAVRLQLEATLVSMPEARDLKLLMTLGTGTFGRVSLVQDPKGQVYALKAMQKAHIVQSHQERNVMNEKRLLGKCAHPFVLKLVATYQDLDCIFMLTDFVQGGELWSLIYEKVEETKECRTETGFLGATCKFYSACVIVALSHIHAQGVAYRDLKPENLLLDSAGYLKVIDFGFAKEIPWHDKGLGFDKGPQQKTYTICGTPEYLAPEIIQSKGHDQAVDCWAIGCLVYELVLGKTPFVHETHAGIFRNVLKSQDILKRKSAWPPGSSADFESVVAALLEPQPAYRATAKSCKAHPWFSGFDWPALASREMAAPYVPRICGVADASNFDRVDEKDYVAYYSGSQQTFQDWSAMGADFPKKR
ncbi:kinase-like domain-containing protein [Pelagophyceae sp. CCMP2097]|nr:kinase-like domain-containing protein [Pelagophyceae sp. CCMP2097]